MRKYRESLALVLIMLLVGGGIALMQQEGLFQREFATNSYSGTSARCNAVSELEQIARYAHDYLNGYLSGLGWGTVLPTDIMQEEMEYLQVQYELVEEMVTQLYPLDHRLEPLFIQFYQGFELALEGLKQNEMECLLKAHKIFHHIDYEIFQHHRSDDPVI